jgi:hypothetical protein
LSKGKGQKQKTKEKENKTMISNLNDVRNKIDDFAKVRETVAIAKEKGLNCDDFTSKEFNAIFKGNKEKPGIISLKTAKALWFDKERQYIRSWGNAKKKEKPFVEQIGIETKTLEKPIPITRKAIIEVATGKKIGYCANYWGENLHYTEMPNNMAILNNFDKARNNGLITLKDVKEDLTEVAVYHYKMNTDFANLEVPSNLKKECKKVVDRARKKCEERLKQVNRYTNLIENS